MSYRVPRAAHNGYDDHSEHEVIELHHDGLDNVLSSVRKAAADLIAQSPVPPSTLAVRAGTVAVEMTWNLSATPQVVEVAPAAAPSTENTAPGGEVLASSAVGVFWRSPAPGAPPFVKEGSQIAAGQQVAILEAMKLMLPVEADRAGRILEVLVKDGESVEFGQPLFRLAPAEQ